MCGERGRDGGWKEEGTLHRQGVGSVPVKGRERRVIGGGVGEQGRRRRRRRKRRRRRRTRQGDSET